MRDVSIDNKWFPREPNYNYFKRDKLLNERLERSKKRLGPVKRVDSKIEIKWCSNCVYPSINARQWNLIKMEFVWGV